MSMTITADSQLQAALSNLHEPSEIRDEAGNLLGLFTPGGRSEDELYRNAFARLNLKKEALSRTESVGRPLAEVWRRLDKHCAFRDALRAKVGHERFELWFATYRRFLIAERSLTVRIPAGQDDWFVETFGECIHEAAIQVFGKSILVGYEREVNAE
jgi:hypothetical protein